MDEKNMSQIFLKIPVERAGVLIGDKGITKFELEKGTGATITVDGKLGDVIIEAPSGGCSTGVFSTSQPRPARNPARKSPTVPSW